MMTKRLCLSLVLRLIHIIILGISRIISRRHRKSLSNLKSGRLRGCMKLRLNGIHSDNEG